MEFAAIFIGVTKAVGSIIQGVEESGQLKAMEANDRIKAGYARENAHTELQLATADADLQRRRGREVTSEQIAAFGQSGFGLGGSTGMVIEDSATAAEMDALSVQYKGVLRSRASNIEAQGYTAQADAEKAARKAIPVKTAIGVATHLLSGYATSQGMKIA